MSAVRSPARFGGRPGHRGRLDGATPRRGTGRDHGDARRPRRADGTGRGAGAHGGTAARRPARGVVLDAGARRRVVRRCESGHHRARQPWRQRDRRCHRDGDRHRPCHPAADGAPDRRHRVPARQQRARRTRRSRRRAHDRRRRQRRRRDLLVPAPGHCAPARALRAAVRHAPRHGCAGTRGRPRPAGRRRRQHRRPAPASGGERARERTRVVRIGTDRVANVGVHEELHRAVAAALG